MPIERASRDFRASSRWFIRLVLCCAVTAPGCSNCRLPRIDPTGERLFVFGESPAEARAAAPLFGNGSLPATPGTVVSPPGAYSASPAP